MKIEIIGSVHQTASPEALRQIFAVLTGRPEDEVVVESRFYSHLMQLGVAPDGVKTLPLSGTVETDLMVSIGGDGTFLRGAKLVAGTGAGILGINSGHLGFLSSMQPEVLREHWEEIRSGACPVDERTMLEASVCDAEGRLLLREVALNEVAIIRRNMATMIRVSAEVEGERMADYMGDGLLVATPTGSSAYAMSVGGPLIHPGCAAMLIIPIAPHSLTMRPVLIPDGMRLSFTVGSRSGTFELALDGRSKAFADSCRVEVKRSSRSVRILHTADYSYFDNLRNKLMWGADRRPLARPDDR